MTPPGGPGPAPAPTRSRTRARHPHGPRAAAWLAAALLLAAGSPAHAQERPAGAWVAPLDGPLEVRRAFAPGPTPYSAGHYGVDLAAEPGATVRAAGAGTVSWAGLLAGRGVVVVAHPSGLRTTYEPVAAAVAAGAAVHRGEPLGTAQPSGHACAAGVPCLHWGLRRGEAYLDPLSLLRRPVRLLPRGGPAPAVLALPGGPAPGTGAGVPLGWEARAAAPPLPRVPGPGLGSARPEVDRGARTDAVPVASRRSDGQGPGTLPLLAVLGLGLAGAGGAWRRAGRSPG